MSTPTNQPNDPGHLGQPVPAAGDPVVSTRPSARVESLPPSPLAGTGAPLVSGGDRENRSGAVPAASRVGARALARLQAGLTPRDQQLLATVSALRLASGRQLQALHFGDSPAEARAARRCLIRLSGHRVLARLQRRVGGVRAGSDGYVYALGPIGERLLERDHGRPRRRRRYDGDPTTGFFEHTLAISDVYVRLQLARKRGQIADLRIQTEPDAWRHLSSSSGEDWLKPDLLVAITTSDNEHHSFVEVDRGTEHARALLKKIRLYELAYRLGTTALSTEIFPRVVWLTPDEARARFLSGLLDSHPQATPELHLVAPIDQATTVLSGGEASDEPGGTPTAETRG